MSRGDSIAWVEPPVVSVISGDELDYVSRENKMFFSYKRILNTPANIWKKISSSSQGVGVKGSGDSGG
jgi:hypothetical protein